MPLERVLLNRIRADKTVNGIFRASATERLKRYTVVWHLLVFLRTATESATILHSSGVGISEGSTWRVVPRLFWQWSRGRRIFSANTCLWHGALYENGDWAIETVAKFGLNMMLQSVVATTPAVFVGTIVDVNGQVKDANYAMVEFYGGFITSDVYCENQSFIFNGRWN